MITGRSYNTFENPVYLSLPAGLLMLFMAVMQESHCRPLEHVRSHTVMHVINNVAALAANTAGYFA